MQPLVSFIIPVYKIEKYLETCVQSILKQTYDDYEILLVDDGSPDRCPYLCDYWAGADTRIKALHKSNGGLSDARNYGLKYAVGKYVIFVDGDDYWTDKNDLMNLMSFAHNHPNGKVAPSATNSKSALCAAFSDTLAICLIAPLYKN